MADKNMVIEAVEPRDNDEVEVEEENGEDNYDEEEFEALNAHLDQLNSVLDNLEMKNDNIHAELVELLKSNKETRKQFQQCMQEGEAVPKQPNSQI